MEGDTNQTTFDVNVHFVVLDKYDTEKNCNDDMWGAYNKCPDLDISPEWIAEDHCLQMKPNKKDVFVMEDFAGRAFDYLQGFKSMIIGPRCLLSCFMTGEPIPDGSGPVFNTAMRDIIVSASGFSGAAKNEIQKKVEYMGGLFTKQLRSSVTHLVTDTVISAKYERAVELNIKIVTIDWIKSVWDTNLKEIVPATDSIFDKYKCPPFYNLVVTSTNLSRRQKEDVKRLISKHGGEFMGILDGTKVKIVITVETNSLSEKLKFAMQNDIPCLKLEWVHDSIEAGYSLPFNKYVIKSTQACSTPEKLSTPEPFDLTSISVIPGDNQNAIVDETLASATTMSSTAMSSTLMENFSIVSRASYITVVERLNIAEAKKAGPFLDGCNIYLTGFTSNYRDKLNRILNVGSATRLDEISDALTHVIVGDPMKAEQDLRSIKSKGLYPYLLKIEWLEECIKIQAPATEENFIFDVKVSSQKSAPEPPSPLSKKNLQLLQRPKIPAVPLFDEPKPKKPVSDEHSKIVEQYLQTSSSKPDNTLREILKLPSNDNLKSKSAINATKEQTFAERWNESVRRQTQNASNMDRDDSAIPISQESIASQKLFQGLTFVISGIEGDEYIQVSTQIRGLGGKVVGDSYSGIPDYGVVPIFGAELKHTVSEIITDLFIEDCIDSERVVDIAYYHKPIQIPNNTKPLENCVIGMSTYSGAERSYLSQLSTALGARYQDTFARKTNPQKKTFSSTHLICPKPQGDKYSAAVKWKLPAVEAEWLLRCAFEMKLVDETPYLVGETMAPDTTIKCNETSIMRPPPDPTPKRPACFNAEEFGEGTSETPIINKRIRSLINGKTPNSPFHISTPETPYGQVFKDNPSPATRKGWVKWIDHFPEIPVDEPPPKRRKSTPLSEVKKQAWDWVTGRSIEDDEDDGRDATHDQDTNNANGGQVATHVTTNRRLSFSDDGSPKKPNPEINKQMAQLEELIHKASSTPEARQSLSGEHANPYHLESNHPPGRCLIKDSQPDSVGWEDPVRRVPPPQKQSVIDEEPEVHDLTNDDDEEESGIEEVQKPKFMFSGIKDKGIAEQFIKEQGGEVSIESSFDPTATHLLCLKPARNEKILSSIAAGKWVLHYRYIEACIDENKFINEEEYELGNPKSQGIIPDPSNENEKVIMTAAHRWRLKLLKNPGGAFQGMIALLMTQTEKKQQFERLISAGGGSVVEAKPPYDRSPRGRKITHCFIQLKGKDQQVDWAMMASKGIMCYPPQYLNDHLCAESPLNPRDSVLPEFKKYLALMPK